MPPNWTTVYERTGLGAHVNQYAKARGASEGECRALFEAVGLSECVAFLLPACQTQNGTPGADAAAVALLADDGGDLRIVYLHVRKPLRRRGYASKLVTDLKALCLHSLKPALVASPESLVDVWTVNGFTSRAPGVYAWRSHQDPEPLASPPKSVPARTAATADTTTALAATTAAGCASPRTDAASRTPTDLLTAEGRLLGTTPVRSDELLHCRETTTVEVEDDDVLERWECALYDEARLGDQARLARGAFVYVDNLGAEPLCDVAMVLEFYRRLDGVDAETPFVRLQFLCRPEHVDVEALVAPYDFAPRELLMTADTSVLPLARVVRGCTVLPRRVAHIRRVPHTFFCNRFYHADQVVPYGLWEEESGLLTD